MKGVPAIYLGQIVDKQHFRTFVYAMNGDKKLVESWDEYEQHMESGLWFSTQEDAKNRVPVEKPKRTRAKAQDKPSCDDALIKDDDFLPKTGD